MKNIHLLVCLLLCTTLATAQKKEKIKGSKTVTVTQREIQDFENLEVEDNLEIFLIKGGAPGFEIEADDNLHDAIVAEQNGNTLRVYTSKDITRFKKLSVRITYTDALKTITAKNETVLNALADLQLENITIKNMDYSKSFLNVRSTNFSLVMDNKASAELNFKGDSCVVQLSKKAELKALIASREAKIDLYEDSKAQVEGDAEHGLIRLDNSIDFTGEKFTVKNLDLTAEGFSDCTVKASDSISISASGKAEISLYGTPKIAIQNFAGTPTLYKKEL